MCSTEPIPVADVGKPTTVTVAIATRNRDETLRECIASVVNQDYPKDLFEVIVVDDESTDGTAEVVRQFVSEGSPRVRYFRQSYGGLSVARNRAVTEGAGDLIAFIDDDAEATPNWISGLVHAADRHPDVGCFGGKLLLRLEGRAPKTCGAESLGATLDLGNEEQAITRVKGCNMAMRRTAFEKVGLFNPALVWRGDEDNWSRRLHQVDGRTLYVPDALVWHRRLAAELRLSSMLKTRFGWGVGQVQTKRESGEQFVPRRELNQLVRGLKHAYRKRCAGGLLEAAIKLGALWGGLRGEFHKPAQRAPSLPSA